MEIKFEIEGLKEIVRGLDPERLAPYLVRAGGKAMAVVRDRLKQYPAPRRNNRARRTGKLRRGWKTRGNREGTMATVVNRTAYAHIVQGGTSAKSWYREAGWIQTSDVETDSSVAGLVGEAYGEEMDKMANDFNRTAGE